MPASKTLRLRICGIIAAAMLIASCTPQQQSETPLQPATEEVVSAGLLGGVRLDAGENAPLILIIPGSGPTDKDGNSPNGLDTNAYKLLAEGLYQDGISTVRVDKRGMFSSKEAGDPNAVTVERYVADYHTWIDALLADKTSECIFLLGHSEGGLMATAAAIGRADVCGLILIAVPGRPLNVILEEQLRANPANAPILDDAVAAISSLQRRERVDTSNLHPALQSLFHENVQGFFISLMQQDPASLLQTADIRTLIIQGGRDLQVSETDAKRLAEAKHSKLFLIPRMNHILKDAPDSTAGNIATYSNPDLPLSVNLVDAISQFVQED